MSHSYRLMMDLTDLFDEYEEGRENSKEYPQFGAPVSLRNRPRRNKVKETYFNFVEREHHGLKRPKKRLEARNGKHSKVCEIFIHTYD